MNKLRLPAAFGTLPGGSLAICLLLAGCEKSDSVATYTVPNHQTIQSPEFLAEYQRSHPKPNRMLVAMMPLPEYHWFFKLEGNPDAVAARENDVREFLKSVRFPAAEGLEWKLPEGWQRLPGNQMRYATLVLDGQPALELSVSSLPTRPDLTPGEQVVMNVNRWRGQLSLPSIKEEDLAQHSEKLTINGSVVYWINIVGRPKPRPAAMAPPPRQAAPAGEKADPASGPTYTKPEGWTEGPPNGFAAVSLQALDGDSKVAITVTSAGGETIGNVNRWRGQLKLEPVSDSELKTSSKKVLIGNLSGDLFEMSNEGKTIFGAIVENRGRTWFIKLMGNTGLAERERLRFEAFLKSLRLE